MLRIAQRQLGRQRFNSTIKRFNSDHKCIHFAAYIRKLLHITQKVETVPQIREEEFPRLVLIANDQEISEDKNCSRKLGDRTKV
jgi:hypothetical protein